MKITSKTINYTVETVEELSTIVGQENDVIVVTDENRGGTFVYRSAEAGVNNDGTIFDGWVRQFSGAVNVKWFGSDTNFSLGGDIKNNSDYSVFVDSITPESDMVGYTLTNFTLDGSNFATLATSTVGSSIVRTLSLERYKLYSIELDINTTAPGRLSIKLGGVSPYKDNAQGYYFSDITPLLDPNEGGIILDNKTYRFSMIIESLNPGVETIKIEIVEPGWTGSIEAIRVQEIVETEFLISGISSGEGDDDIISTDIVTPSKYNPIGIKVGRNWFGATVFGDRQTASLLQNPGTYSSGNGGLNVAIGKRALSTNILGMQNTAVGVDCMTFTEGSHNTAMGYGSLKYNTKGQQNTAIGYKSQASNTIGYNNTSLGFWAGALNQDGFGNTNIGTYSRNAEHGNRNTSIGYYSGIVDSGGSDNVFIGYKSGSYTSLLLGANKFSGRVAIGSNTQVNGSGNISLGNNSISGIEGNYVSDVAYALAVGDNAKATATLSIALGKTALASGFAAAAIGNTSIASGDYSIAIGRNTKASGINTTAVGYASGTANIVGTNCTFLGFLSGSATVAGYSNVTTLGNNAQVTGSNQVQLGDSATTTYVYGTVQNRSDIRDKDEVQDSDLGLEFINKLRPVKYKWDLRDSYYEVTEDEEGNAIRVETPKDGSKKGNRFHYGLIAQELKEVSDSIGVDFGGLQDHTLKGGSDVMSIGYDELISPLIKAIQELTARVKELEAK